VRVFLIVTAAVALILSVNLHAQEPDATKAVLVTGASSGIGLKIAETLAQNGFFVYAGARKEADLARLDAMDNISAVRLDVTVDEDIASAVEFVKAQGRGLWGIVNNAGVYRYAPLIGGPESDFRLTLDVNVLGPIRINQAFVPLVIESDGRTVVIGSLSGFIPEPEDGGYAASKFAMEGYTDSLAMELENTGVHVAIVEPGSFKSNIRDTMFEAAVAAAESGNLELGEATQAGLASSVDRNESMKDPDEVAQAVLHLMTSDSPKRRYMVAPNAQQAATTIRFAMARMLELNQDQPYTYSRDELVALLDELMSKSIRN
jgi:NAD(P)-dependent dehydrogenase (short-subunit alcohol dehydrogenase family)